MEAASDEQSGGEGRWTEANFPKCVAAENGNLSALQGSSDKHHRFVLIPSTEPRPRAHGVSVKV